MKTKMVSQLLKFGKIRLFQCGTFDGEDFIYVNFTQTSAVVMTKLTDVGSFRKVIIVLTFIKCVLMNNNTLVYTLVIS